MKCMNCINDQRSHIRALVMERGSPGVSPHPGRRRRREGDAHMPPDTRDEEEETHARLSLSQLTRERLLEMREGGGVQAGVLETVELRNFMCHTNLCVKLNGNVNFIAGQNGSGKSAILAGITLCLGQRADTTDRGAAVRSFVKTGVREAVVAVSICNQGREKFLVQGVDKYGDRIVVERRIKSDSSGASSYTLKNQNGKVISHAKKDLAMILDYFNIQVDNPCVVMSQEQTKEFLRTSDPKKRYKFFLRATLLEQMRTDLRDVRQRLETAQATIERRTDMLPDMEEAFRVRETAWKEAQEMVNLQDRRKDLQNMLAWAYVEDRETRIERADGEIAKQQLNVEKLRVEIDIQKTEIDHLHNQQEEKMREIKAQHDQGRAFVAQLKEKKRDFELCRRDARRIMKEIGDVEADIHNKETNLAKLDKQIVETQKQVLQESCTQKEAREERIRQLEREIQEARDHQSHIKKQRDEVTEQQRAVSERFAQLGREARDAATSLNRHKNNLHALDRSDRSGVHNLFGKGLDRVVAEIERCSHMFRVKPLGPIGSHLTVSDSRWSVAIESCLQWILAAFLVHTKEDEMQLRSLFQRLGMERDKWPSIIRFDLPQHVYDVSERAPDRRFQTILGMLRTDERERCRILNALIDQKDIEQCVLAENYGEAKAIVLDGNWRKHPNVKEVYTREGTKVFVRHGDETIVPRQVKQPRLAENKEEQARLLREQIARGEKRHTDLVAEKGNLERTREELATTQKRIYRALNEGQEKINSLEDTNRDLEAQESEEEQNGDVGGLQAEVLEGKKEIAEMTTTLEAKHKQRGSIEQRMRPLQEEMKQLESQKDAFQPDLRRHDEELEKITLALNTERFRLKEREAKASSYQEKIETWLSMLQKQRETLESELERAIQLCPRNEVTVTMPIKRIEAELKAVQTRLDQETERRGVSLTDLRLQYESARAALKKVKRNIANTQRNRDKLEIMYKQRRQKWLAMRKLISKRTSYFFNRFLSEKGHAGSANFDHDEEALHLHVDLNAAVMPSSLGQESQRGMRQLSGGERAFTTLAFIMALGEVMACPIRAFDEFDVFMDDVHRHVALRLLLETTLNHRNKQFIFITPHSLSNIPNRDQVKIHILRAPERSGQRQPRISEFISPTPPPPPPPSSEM